MITIILKLKGTLIELLETLFSSTLIHIMCVAQQGGVCDTESKLTAVCVFMVMMGHVNRCSSVAP